MSIWVRCSRCASDFEVSGEGTGASRLCLTCAASATPSPLPSPPGSPLPAEGSPPTRSAEPRLKRTTRFGHRTTRLLVSRILSKITSPSEAVTYDRLGDYEIAIRIGRGGMGEVLKAMHRESGEWVAIKILGGIPSQIDEVRKLFSQEASILTVVNHPNLVKLIGDGLAPDGRYYIVMELLDGLSLNLLLEGFRRKWEKLVKEEMRWPPPPIVPIPIVLQIMDGISAGVGHAHSHGVVHLDLKPSNVFIERNGNPRVLDFGIAWIHRPTARFTASSVGTPYYMSPEQWFRPEAITARSDVFALGLILYELLSGELPHQIDEPPKNGVWPSMKPIRDWQPTLSFELEAVIAKALAIDPEERYANANELRRAIAAAGGQVIGSPLRSATQTGERPAPRKEAPVAPSSSGEKPEKTDRVIASAAPARQRRGALELTRGPGSVTEEIQAAIGSDRYARYRVLYDMKHMQIKRENPLFSTFFGSWVRILLTGLLLAGIGAAAWYLTRPS